MVIKTTRFGDSVESAGDDSSVIINNKKTDRFGNIIEVEKPISKDFKFSSIAKNPKEEKEEGFIEKYIVDPITAGATGS
jgi:hypothetical protein